MKKGFNISIGWNLGKRGMSNHLFAPLTSVPIKGTRNNNKRDIIKKYGRYALIISLFWREIKKIIISAIITNTKCFKKKKITFIIYFLTNNRWCRGKLKK